MANYTIKCKGGTNAPSGAYGYVGALNQSGDVKWSSNTSYTSKTISSSYRGCVTAYAVSGYTPSSITHRSGTATWKYGGIYDGYYYWYTASNISSDETVMINYTAPAPVTKYSVNAYRRGGNGSYCSISANPSSVESGKSSVISGSVSSSDYQLNGKVYGSWNSGNSGGFYDLSNGSFTSTNITSNESWYVYFDTRITTTFDANGGGWMISSEWYTTKDVYEWVNYPDDNINQRKFSLPNAPEYAGKTFAGWFTAASGGTQVTTSTVVRSIMTSNGTLYAQWTDKKYTVKAESNQSSSVATVTVSSTSVTYGTTVTFKAYNISSDYTFDGWYLGSTKVSSGDSTTYHAYDRTIYSDTTITAHFTAKPKYNYSVSFTSSGTYKDLPSGQTWTNTTATAVTYTIPDTAPQRTNGYVFNNYTYTNGEGEEVTVKPGSKITLTAKWMETVTVTANWTALSTFNYVTSSSNNSTWGVAKIVNISKGSKITDYKYQQVDRLAECTFNAIINPDYSDVIYVDDWEVNGVSLGLTSQNIKKTLQSFIVNSYVSDKSYDFKVKFGKYASYQITVSTTGNGTVSGGGNYRSGTFRTVTATPDEDYALQGWFDLSTGIRVSTDESYTFQLTGDIKLQARFTRIFRKVSLTASPSSGGTVQSRKSDSEEWHEGEYSYWQGADVVIKATANTTSNYSFQKWDDGSTTAERTIRVGTSDISKTAYFGFKYSIVVGKTAGITKATINDNETSLTIWAGEKVNLYCEVDASYKFLGWYTGDDELITISTTYKNYEPVKSQTITAKAELNQVRVRTSISPSDSGNVSGAGTYTINDYAYLSVTPNEGYEFVQWSDGNRNNPRSIKITRALNLTASMTLTQHEIDVSADPSNGGTVLGGGIYTYWDTCTLRATPDKYFNFIEWSDGDKSNPKRFTVKHDVEIEARFKQRSHIFAGSTRILYVKLGDIDITNAFAGSNEMYERRK